MPNVRCGARVWPALILGLIGWLWCKPAAALQQELPNGVALTGAVRPANAVTTPKLQAALEQHRRDVDGAKSACTSGASDACALLDWQDLLKGLASAPPWQQLEAVNLAVNRFPYRDDFANWGRQDHWSPPQELFARGGDCEDFAIAKYLSLRALGYAADDLLLASFRDPVRRQVHLVLIVLLPEGTVVLDSETDVILPWRSLDGFRLLYALNEDSALFQLARQ